MGVIKAIREVEQSLDAMFSSLNELEKTITAMNSGVERDDAMKQIGVIRAVINTHDNATQELINVIDEMIKL